MSGNFDVEKRVLIDKMLNDCIEDMTKDKVDEYYEYIRDKFYIYNLPKECDLMHVLKQRFYGRGKWWMIDSPINKLKVIQAKRETYKRPYFIEVLKQIG
jgi:hypothetical protein